MKGFVIAIAFAILLLTYRVPARAQTLDVRRQIISGDRVLIVVDALCSPPDRRKLSGRRSKCYTSGRIKQWLGNDFLRPTP